MHSHCYQPPPVPIQRPPSQRLIFCRRIRNGKSQTKRKEKSLYGSPGKRSSYYFFNYGVTESPPHYSFLIEKSFTLSYIASQTLSLSFPLGIVMNASVNIYGKRERGLNMNRLMPFLLTSLAVASIFSFFLAYCPNPILITSKEALNSVVHDQNLQPYHDHLSHAAPVRLIPPPKSTIASEPDSHIYTFESFLV